MTEDQARLIQLCQNKEPIFCSNCVHFHQSAFGETYGDDFCAAPENQTFKKDAYGSRPAVRFIPYEKNKNNNCEWYSKKPPSWLERILGNIDGAV